ncbi:MAG: cation transporting ATPase C-terminal domain-containing protein [Kiritimatiellia bacterium]
MNLADVPGLSEAEARIRLEREGCNELPAQKKRGVLSIALEVVREPMFIMLLAAGGLYLLMGEPADALMLLGFVFVVMAITIIQEQRTERALDALRDLSSPRALVFRDGVRRRIPGREVVRGDMVVLAEGDRIPADAILRRSVNLSVDESLLPVHIVFLELIIDPACTLIFEAEKAEDNVMQRRPRSPAERLFSRGTIGAAIMQGVSVLAVCVGVFLLARANHSADAARALTFASLVVSFIVIILVNRSWTKSAWSMLFVPNAAMRWVLLGASTFLVVVLMVPFAQQLFHFAPLHAKDLILSLGAGLVCVLWFEVYKRIHNPAHLKKQPEMMT